MPSLVYMTHEQGETSNTEELQGNAGQSLADGSLDEAGRKSAESSERNDEVSGSRSDGGKSGADANGRGKRLPRRVDSFRQTLATASEARLKAS